MLQSHHTRHRSWILPLHHHLGTCFQPKLLHLCFQAGGLVGGLGGLGSRFGTVFGKQAQSEAMNVWQAMKCHAWMWNLGDKVTRHTRPSPRSICGRCFPDSFLSLHLSRVLLMSSDSRCSVEERAELTGQLRLDGKAVTPWNVEFKEV